MADDWRRYAAPAAFLLAVTIAVVLIRSGLESGGSPASSGATTAAPPKRVATTTRSATTTTRAGSAKAYWTVRAGDTYGVIAAKTGVPVATLERLNPRAGSTSLFIGEKIRYR